MRIYISGAISGVSGYKEKFAKAEMWLKEQGYSVVNPAIMDYVIPGATYEEYMKIDLALLEMCDEIYMLQGWQESKGANGEYGFALAKDMILMYEKQDDLS